MVAIDPLTRSSAWREQEAKGLVPLQEDMTRTWVKRVIEEVQRWAVPAALQARKGKVREIGDVV